MLVKTSELTDAALDWAVAIAAGLRVEILSNKEIHDADLMDMAVDSGTRCHPSTSWAQAGPIIEREKLCVGHTHQAWPVYLPLNDPLTNCWARTTPGGYLSYGPTPLIAAMRCYVASKLGDEVEIPDGLTQRNKHDHT